MIFWIIFVFTIFTMTYLYHYKYKGFCFGMSIELSFCVTLFLSSLVVIVTDLTTTTGSYFKEERIVAAEEVTTYPGDTGFAKVEPDTRYVVTLVNGNKHSFPVKNVVVEITDSKTPVIVSEYKFGIENWLTKTTGIHCYSKESKIVKVVLTKDMLKQ